MAKANAETPLMQQHNAIKAKYPDAILLFRVGDFYETFAFAMGDKNNKPIADYKDLIRFRRKIRIK